MRRHLRGALAEDARGAFADALANEFAAHCPVGGAAAADYRNRWLDLPGAGPGLVGIRFKGGDLAEPFVDVVVTTEPVATAKRCGREEIGGWLWVDLG